MTSNYDRFYRKHRGERTFFNRWRVYTFRSHPERGYTRHWFLYGRDERGGLESNINEFQLAAYRIRRWRLAAEVRVADGATGADELTLFLALPFIGMIFLSAARIGRLVRWLGVEWAKDKDVDDMEREAGVDWNRDHLTISLWANQDKHWGSWRYHYINLNWLLLGHPKYSETPRESHEAVLTMPEGAYPLKVELYTASWKQPRWPRVRSIRRADVEVLAKGGVPFPGKGESEYDLGDDAVFSLTCPAKTVEEAVEALRASVMRDREKNAGPDWRPKAEVHS